MTEITDSIVWPPHYLCEDLNNMMRVTVRAKPKAVIVQVEGRIVGLWVPELKLALEHIIHVLGSRKLCVDLAGVLFMDRDAIQILRETQYLTGAQLVANTPLTKFFAEQAMSHKTIRS